MNNNLVVVSPKCTSDSAIELANLLDVSYIPVEDIHDLYQPQQKIINWGCSKLEGFAAERIILNKPGAVRRSLNKLTTFSLLSDKVRMPTMTKDKEVAVQWAKDGRKVMVRERIKGCKGQGITKTSDPIKVNELPAKFYTRFIENCTEFRVNCYKNKIISVYYKLPCGNDFAFKISHIYINLLNVNDLQPFVNSVVENLKLDMFGLDILRAPSGKLFLLEVNSAPILFPISVKRLVKEIKKDFVNE